METRAKSSFDTDVLVVGGGLVGQSLAIALANAGVGVMVLDRMVPETTLASEHDGRASAISFASQEMMRAISVWDKVSESQLILEIRVSKQLLRCIGIIYSMWSNKLFSDCWSFLIKQDSPQQW